MQAFLGNSRGEMMERRRILSFVVKYATTKEVMAFAQHGFTLRYVGAHKPDCDVAVIVQAQASETYEIHPRTNVTQATVCVIGLVHRRIVFALRTCHVYNMDNYFLFFPR